MTKNEPKAENAEVGPAVIDQVEEGPGGNGYSIPENAQARAGFRFITVSMKVSPPEREMLINLCAERGNTSFSGLLRSLIEEEAKKFGLWPPPPSEELHKRMVAKLMERSDLRAKHQELLAAKRGARAGEE